MGCRRRREAPLRRRKRGRRRCFFFFLVGLPRWVCLGFGGLIGPSLIERGFAVNNLSLCRHKVTMLFHLLSVSLLSFFCLCFCFYFFLFFPFFFYFPFSRIIQNVLRVYKQNVHRIFKECSPYITKMFNIFLNVHCAFENSLVYITKISKVYLNIVSAYITKIVQPILFNLYCINVWCVF